MKIEEKINKIKSLTGKTRRKSMIRFVLWARNNRYTMNEIGSWFGVTKQNILYYVKLSTGKFDRSKTKE